MATPTKDAKPESELAEEVEALEQTVQDLHRRNESVAATLRRSRRQSSELQENLTAAVKERAGAERRLKANHVMLQEERRQIALKSAGAERRLVSMEKNLQQRGLKIVDLKLKAATAEHESMRSEEMLRTERQTNGAVEEELALLRQRERRVCHALQQQQQTISAFDEKTNRAPQNPQPPLQPAMTALAVR